MKEKEKDLNQEKNPEILEESLSKTEVNPALLALVSSTLTNSPGDILTAASVGSSLNRSADVSIESALSFELFVALDSDPPQLSMVIINIISIGKSKKYKK